MKLSISNCGVNEYLGHGATEAETLAAIRSCGFSHVDLDVRREYLEGDMDANANRVKDLLSEAGLTASMAHAPGVNPLKHEAEARESAIAAMRFCKKVGIPILVVHPGAIKGNTREEFFAGNARFYRSLIPYIEKTGVTVAIENIGNYADPYFLWNGADLRELVELVGHPMVNACWDIGHANHFFEKDCEQYTSIMALGERLVAIHAHDNCGYIADTYKHIRLDMHTLPYFSHPASVNWDAVMQGLKDVGYKGTFNFEVIAPASSDRAPFVYHGREINTLAMMPLDVWTAVNSALYKMGCVMLDAYDLSEK